MDVGYVWNEDKYEQVQHKHQMAFAEVVEVFEDPHGLEQPDPQHHHERFMLVGATSSRRILQVIYTETYTEDASMLWRIITAFDAGDAWSHEYQQQFQR